MTTNINPNPELFIVGTLLFSTNNVLHNAALRERATRNSNGPYPKMESLFGLVNPLVVCSSKSNDTKGRWTSLMIGFYDVNNSRYIEFSYAECNQLIETGSLVIVK